MSYQKDLDEMTDRVLQDELQRRQELRSHGRCSYCRQFLATSQAGTKKP